MIEDLSFEVPLRSNGYINPFKITDEMFNEICALTPFLENTSRKSLSERIYCIKNNLTEVPKCPECGEKTNFSMKYGLHYTTFCSNKCANNSTVSSDKRKETCVERFGVENPFMNLEIQKNIKETYVERFGCAHPMLSPEIKEKKNATTLKKFGVPHHFQLEEIKEKREMTWLSNYGVSNPSQSEEIQLKKRKSCLKKYGVDNPSKSKEIKDKLSISLAKNYQSRRNEAGDDYSGIVYILHFPELEAVKIGLTASQGARFKCLKRDFGAFSIIELIETETCRKLESYLHEKFSEYRICFDEGCGRTEFFKEEILHLL